MVAGLHGPYLISPGRKSFGCIALHAYIHKQRLPILVERKAAGIVMVVIIPVMSRLDRQAEGIAVYHKQAHTGIINIRMRNRFWYRKRHNLLVMEDCKHSIEKIDLVNIIGEQMPLGYLKISGSKLGESRLPCALAE